MRQRPARAGGVLAGVDWSRWSVVLLKPDCVRRGLNGAVLDRLSVAAEITHQREITVADWQIHVHYWDMLVDRHWFDVDVPACLRRTYVDQTVVVALAYGPEGVDTPSRLRDLLGHFDPTTAEPGSIRADLGDDSLTAARGHQRLVENLVHTSDDAAATCRDFGTWFGTDQHQLLVAGAQLADAPRARLRRPLI